MTALELGIVTADAARLVRFYVDGLGFEPFSVNEFPQGAVHRIVRDSARIKIYQPVDGAERPVPADPWHQFSGMAYGALLVADAQAEVDRAVAHGGTLRVPVTNHRPGAWFALLADPEGNVWEILQETPT